PYFSWTADAVDAAGSDIRAPRYIFVEANIWEGNTSVKAYIWSMGRALKTTELPELFAALADPTRLRLLNLMNGREVCVCYFVEILKQSQPKISRHLAYLRRAGIVSARREGKWMHYKIEWPRDAAASTVLETTLRSLNADGQMQADLVRLERACCEPQRFVTLEGAPAPVRM
ncbi:MAG TPA: metalloregulator ArsR/SmtB family transcription factor, partial [Acidobacteriaceae bacterium]|nr:metalloregulator ArsR/SmtB family transcription factor [Acidobacteriaceae bacterium]